MDPNHNPNCVYQGRCNNYKCLMCHPNNVKYADILDKSAAPKPMDMSDMVFFGLGGFFGLCIFVIFFPILGPMSFFKYSWKLLGNKE